MALKNVQSNSGDSVILSDIDKVQMGFDHARRKSHKKHWKPKQSVVKVDPNKEIDKPAATTYWPSTPMYGPDNLGSAYSPYSPYSTQSKLTPYGYHYYGSSDDTDSIQICVMDTSHKTIVIDTKTSRTVESVMETIRDKLSIPVDQQRLVCAGKSLEKKSTLQDCGVVQESTLFLHLFIIGGSYNYGNNGGYANSSSGYGNNDQTSGGYGDSSSGYSQYGQNSSGYGNYGQTSGGYGDSSSGYSQYGQNSSGYGNYGQTSGGYGDSSSSYNSYSNSNSSYNS